MKAIVGPYGVDLLVNNAEMPVRKVRSDENTREHESAKALKNFEIVGADGVDLLVTNGEMAVRKGRSDELTPADSFIKLIFSNFIFNQTNNKN